MRGAILTLLAFACGLLTAGAKADTDSDADRFAQSFYAGEKAGARCTLDVTQRILEGKSTKPHDTIDCIHAKLHDAVRAHYGADTADRFFFEDIPPAVVNGEIRVAP